MDEQSYLRWALGGIGGVLTAILAFVGVGALHRISAIESEAAQLRISHTECKAEALRMELEVNKNYVSKAEYAETMRRLFDEIKALNTNITEIMRSKQDKA